MMFTLSDIQNIAIQIERNGEAAYRQAGEKTIHRDLSEMLIRMADEERRHIQWFRELSTDGDVDPAHREVERMGRELLQQMIHQQTFSLNGDRLNDAGNIAAMLSQSLNFEKDTILFYEMLGSFIDDPETLGQLERIIDEEHMHVAQIERMQRNWKG